MWCTSPSTSPPPRLRTRSNRDSYLVSAWDPWTGTWFLISAFHALLFLPRRALSAPAEIIAAVVLATVCFFVTGRRRIVIQADGAWGDILALGVRWSRRRLGRHPMVEAGGWDWTEISAYPASGSTLSERDDQRFVLVEWTRRNAESDRLQYGAAVKIVEQIRSEIDRLHGPRSEPKR